MRNKTKVTPQDVERAIARETFVVLDDGKTTICNLILHNGFSVRGESACVDPRNFNLLEGRHWARVDAVRKVWPVLGAILADRMHVQAGGVSVLAAYEEPEPVAPEFDEVVDAEVPHEPVLSTDTVTAVGIGDLPAAILDGPDGDAQILTAESQPCDDPNCVGCSTVRRLAELCGEGIRTDSGPPLKIGGTFNEEPSLPEQVAAVISVARMAFGISHNVGPEELKERGHVYIGRSLAPLNESATVGLVPALCAQHANEAIIDFDDDSAAGVRCELGDISAVIEKGGRDVMVTRKD